jgi:hypothetical protein
VAVENPQLESIVTHPLGTILQYGDVLFYDANNNLQLDASDKKATIQEKNCDQIDFYRSTVSEQDIKSFGNRVAADLRQARKERDLLLRMIPPQKNGECILSPETNKNGEVIIPAYPRSFQPPLSVRTVVFEKKRYHILDIQSGKNLRVVDPARCFSARNIFFQDNIANLPLDRKEIEISTGRLLTPTFLTVFRLQNGDGADVAYSMLKGAERVHIDLTP